MKNILIIDGDVLAYRAAAISEERSIEALHVASGKTKVFKTRTTFKSYLKEKDIDYVEEDYLITDVQTPLFLEIATNVLDRQIQRFKEALVASEVHIYISGKDNFRGFLPLPKKYKGNRDENLRPLHLKACREHLLKNYKTTESHGHEADDEVIIKGYEELAKGNKPIICTVDKDAKAYGGLYLFDPTQEIPEIKLTDDFGFLEKTDKGVKGEGFLWYCQQMLSGDSVDGYKPSQIFGVKFGEVSAYNLLKDCKSKEEAIKVVEGQYFKWCPSTVEYTDWEGALRIVDALFLLQLYHRCVRMKEHKDDSVNYFDFLDKYNLSAVDLTTVKKKFFRQHGKASSAKVIVQSKISQQELEDFIRNKACIK